MTATTATRRLPKVEPRLVLAGAVVSVVTMPLTAAWFLLLGGLLLVAGLVVAVLRNVPLLGGAGSLGLGLLAGPAVYIGLALVLFR